ncbi:15315_t:CDS:2, partial [Gigaspora rosea]
RQLKTANLLKDLVITPNNIKCGTSIIGEELTASTTLLTRNWEMQVKSVCAEIMKVLSDPVKRLYNYYQLGAVLENQAWSERLYSSRGLDNLFLAKQITPFVLSRMYEEDFSILLEEARVMKELEFNELINLTNELLGVTLQEVENVTN